MIDLNNLEKYRENNRIEAKKALGGLPHSIWETYSAFANTLGGIILLGVEEYRDKTLHPVDLPYPEELVREFWDMVNDPRKASVNVLSSRDVTIEDVNGAHIIVISVPRADRTYKPVYVDGSPLNSYRRSGEGDHRCTSEELYAMYRDASVKTQDMVVLEKTDLGVIGADTLRKYRADMRLSRPGHVWEALDDTDFLCEIGAAGIGEDGKTRPTAAGLLMFGSERNILREYPQYSLDYREERGGSRMTERIISSSGDWSGNIFDFFSRVTDRLRRDPIIRTDAGGDTDASAQVFDAVREALANCLINADYYGRQGLAVIRRDDGITMSNPGNFRIELAAARLGGVSDPRNSAMLKMFNLIDVGERSGSGIPNIFRVWKSRGWAEPSFLQTFSPDRITLLLPLSPASGETPSPKIFGAAPAVKEVKRQLIIEYLTDHASAGAEEIAEYADLDPALARDHLTALIADDIVIAAAEGGRMIYRLKA